MKYRRGLWTMLWRLVRRGRLDKLAGAAVKYRRLRRAYRDPSGRTAAAPLLAHLFVTAACSMACPGCAVRNRDRRADAGTAEWLSVIAALAELGVDGVAFTGGEPLLRDDLFTLVRAARARGLTTIIATNGLALETRLVDLLRAKPDIVNISLDGVTPAVHDAIRGEPGNFAQVTANLRLLTAARPHPEVVVSAVIEARNAAELTAMPAFIAGLGADRLVVCPRHTLRDGAVIAAPLPAAEIGSRLRASPHRALIDNSDYYLGHIDRVAAGEPPPAGCSAADTTMFISPELDVYRCKADLMAGRPLARREDHGMDLARLWHSEAYCRARRAARTCRGCWFSVNRELDPLCQ